MCMIFTAAKCTRFLRRQNARTLYGGKILVIFTAVKSNMVPRAEKITWSLQGKKSRDLYNGKIILDL